MRPKILVTGIETVAGVVHIGFHPDMVRTCPFEPLMRPMVFPVRVNPLLKERISENSPVVEL